MDVLYLRKEVWGVEFCFVWARVIGKGAQPKNPPENTRLFYFSPKMRASVGCSQERRGCPRVALGKPTDMLLKHLFFMILGGDF